jgi:signal transduction histidine kinase
MDSIRDAKPIAAESESEVTASPEAQPEELAKVLPFLHAVRWGAWTIAWVVVWVGHLPAVNQVHEPVLLAVTFTQILAATLYVPLLRSRVRQAWGAHWGPKDDLIVIGLADIALVLVVIYFSGGWGSPYYHYALASLLVPAFLVGWRRSVLLLIAFLGAFFAILATAGRGLDGSWIDEDIAAIILTPALVIAVVQYMAQLMRRLDQQREQAQRALHETSALYKVAQTVATADTPETLVQRVVDSLEELARFRGLAIFSLEEGGRLSSEAGFGDTGVTQSRLSPDQLQTLSTAEAAVRLETRQEAPATALAVPVSVQEKLWGILACSSRGDGPADLRLVQTVAGQLSLGLTKIALSRQKEELAAQEERSRIAREIHDGIAQSIYMLSLNLEKAAEVARDDERLGQRLGGLVGLAKEALLEVRHYIFDLKPLLAGDVSLAGTIRAQMREFSAVAGLPVELRVEGTEQPIPPAVGSALYRITQEALANVFRHADAKSIEALLAFNGDGLSLEIRDDGQGFGAGTEGDAASLGRGLRNIYQRAAEAGGDAEILSTPGRGTTVRVNLPLGGRTL